MKEKFIHKLLLSYGDRIRVARIKAGLRQLDLARALGCSQSVISHIECGYMLPPPRIKKAISDLFLMKI